jgi:large subunit ribosomal protein L6
MSRIGKVPINIPSGVQVTIESHAILVKGPKGDLRQEISPLAKVDVAEETIQVSPANDTRSARAIYGTTRSLIANMVKGVTEPFSYSLRALDLGPRSKGRQ